MAGTTSGADPAATGADPVVTGAGDSGRTGRNAGAAGPAGAPDVLAAGRAAAAAAGTAIRRQVLGDAHVDRATAAADEFTTDFQNLITRYAWGEVWARPGLDRRTRSCVTLAILAALGRDHELGLHVTGALRNGLTQDEIKEVLLQVAVYAGVPAANAAFAVAQRTLSAAMDTRP